jgi:UDP-perosamine 4-acetyltransferase
MAALRRLGVEMLGVIDPDREVAARLPSGIPWLGDDGVLAAYPPGRCDLVNGVGSVGDPRRRRLVFEALSKAGYAFLPVRHPDASIAADAVVGEGAQVMAGAVLQAGVHVGANAIINTRAAVDHDCRVGAHVHVAPGALLCGGVEVGDETHLGAGAVVVQGIRIGKGCLIGAGALIRRDVADHMIVYDARQRLEKPRL